MMAAQCENHRPGAAILRAMARLPGDAAAAGPQACRFHPRQAGFERPFRNADATHRCIAPTEKNRATRGGAVFKHAGEDIRGDQ